VFDPNRTFQLTKGAIVDPEATWRGYLPEADDWRRTAFLLTGPLIVLAALIAYLIGLLAGDAGMFGGLRPTLGSTIVRILTGAIGAAVVAWVVSILAGMFGGRQSFARGLAATTLAFVPGYVGQALTPLPWVGGLIALGLAIYALVLLWRILPLYLDVPQGKRIGHYILSLVTTFVVMFVIGMLLSPVLGPDVPEWETPGTRGAIGDIGSGGSSAPASGGVLGGAIRYGELMAAAEEDRYQPPADGRLTEAQVREFIRVMKRSEELSGEKEARLKQLSEKAEGEQELSMGDIGEMMAGATEFMGLGTIEIEVVKGGGGNWAEHQWVKNTLRTAWVQKDINDTVAHNYALYQKYESELKPFVAR
jgi:hypothetical protein